MDRSSGDTSSVVRCFSHMQTHLSLFRCNLSAEPPPIWSLPLCLGTTQRYAPRPWSWYHDDRVSLSNHCCLPRRSSRVIVIQDGKPLGAKLRPFERSRHNDEPDRSLHAVKNVGVDVDRAWNLTLHSPDPRGPPFLASLPGTPNEACQKWEDERCRRCLRHSSRTCCTPVGL